MDFSNWSGWKTVKLILTAATTFELGMVAGFPGTNTAHLFTQAGIVTSVILATVVTLSGTNLGPTLAKTYLAKQVKDNAVKP